MFIKITWLMLTSGKNWETWDDDSAGQYTVSITESALGDSWPEAWAGFKRPEHDTVTLVGDGSLISEVWMDREETLKWRYVDLTHSVGRGFHCLTRQFGVAWYMVAQSGPCLGLQPIWESWHEKQKQENTPYTIHPRWLPCIVIFRQLRYRLSCRIFIYWFLL